MEKMKNQINLYLNREYFLSVATSTKLQLFYLLLPLLLLLLTFGTRFYIFIRGKRPAAYRQFDFFWFWGFLSFAVIGLFIYFSRLQELPIFSTRAISYLWIFLLLTFVGFLCGYYKIIIPGEIKKYYEAKRKAKYLKK